MSEVAPMVSGGQWLAEGGTGTPQYIANPDHVARLLSSGWQAVADPRLPVPEPEPEPEPEQDTEPPIEGL